MLPFPNARWVSLWLAIVVLSGSLAIASDRAGRWPTPEGEELAFDGVFYSYRTADGLRAFKVWTPPTEGPIRALLIFGNPGGGFGGDTRDKTRQQDILEFAAREGIAVAGVTGFPGREVYGSLGRHVLRGLQAMAAKGIHPELAEIPMIASGGSNAGSFSYGLLCLVPERMIAITPNVGSYHSLSAPEAAWEVPVWIHIGARDELSSAGVEETEGLFRENGTRGRLFWTWDAEMKGHENGGADHVDFAFWEAMLKARLPAEPTRPGERVPLRTLAWDQGWLADLRTWDHRITRVFPASEQPVGAEAGRYGWLPNRGLARLYQANATRSRPLLLERRDAAPVQANGTSGVFLSAGQGHLVDPGQVVKLKVTGLPLLRGVTRVAIFDRDEPVAETDLSKGGECEIVIDGRKKLYALFAHAEQTGFNGEKVERISAPLQLLVRDPGTSARIAAQLEPYGFVMTARAQARIPVTPSAAAAPEREIPEEATLRAYAWSPEEAATVRRDGQVGSAWANLPTPAVAIGPGHALKGRGLAHADVRVKAAWTASGLYLLQEVGDRSWAVGQGGAVDTLDFHLASVDARRVAGVVPAVEDLAKPGSTALLSSMHQIQIAVGGDKPDGSTGINFTDPWDLRRAELMAADGFEGSGYWAEVVQLENGRRAVEIFLPWYLVGRPGFAEAPRPGVRLALALGYQDGESGGKLMWPAGRDPWHGVATEAEPAPYGQLRLMPPP